MSAPAATAGTPARGDLRALRRVVHLLDLDGRRLAATVAAGSAGLGSAVALTAVSAWLIARASQMPPVLDLSVAVVAVRAFGVSRAVFRYLERLAAHSVALRGIGALREQLYARIAAGRTDAVVALRRGDVLARTGADVDAVGDVVVRALVPAAVATVVGAATVVLVAAFLPGAALVLLVALLLAGLAAPVLTARAARVAERAVLAERGAVSAVAMTAVESAGELAVSGRAPALFAELGATEARVATATDRAAGPAALGAGLNVAAMGLALLGAVLLGIPATTAGVLAPVELAVVVLVPLAAFEATAVLPAAAAQLVRSAAAARRIVELLDRAERVPEAPPPDLVATPQVPVRPGLVARGLACGWPGGPPVLDDVDLDVPPGRLVAVVGASGTGKTTLLLTLAGLLPPRGGWVRADGRDPWALDRAEVSRSVVVTAEDAHVFETTLLENLRVARGDVTVDEARAALVAAGLGDWLRGLPDGLDTTLGGDGATVSGGERRRLLLARALLTRAPVLLLDEPGEHLDPAGADALVADVLRATADAGRGVVLVTHRLQSLDVADEVLLLGPGAGTEPRGPAAATGVPASRRPEPARVVARGSHAELVATVAEYAWWVSREQAHTGATTDGAAAAAKEARS